MFGTLASASGSFVTIPAMNGVTHALICVMTPLNPQKESDEFGISASANGSLKFGTKNSADGRMTAILATILTRAEEEQELQAHPKEEEDDQPLVALQAANLVVTEEATEVARKEAMEKTTEVKMKESQVEAPVKMEDSAPTTTLNPNPVETR